MLHQLELTLNREMMLKPYDVCSSGATLLSLRFAYAVGTDDIFQI